MSKWYALKNEDIELDDGEFNLHVNSDDQGNNYATLTIAQVIRMAVEIYDYAKTREGAIMVPLQIHKEATQELEERMKNLVSKYRKLEAKLKKKEKK